MVKILSPDDLVKIASNLSWLLYGISLVLGLAGLLFGFILKYISSKFKKLERMEYIEHRIDGIESFTHGLIKMDAKMTLIEERCKQLCEDRRKENKPVKIDRRKR
jgi:hypothetical protein